MKILKTEFEWIILCWIKSLNCSYFVVNNSKRTSISFIFINKLLYEVSCSSLKLSSTISLSFPLSFPFPCPFPFPMSFPMSNSISRTCEFLTLILKDRIAFSFSSNNSFNESL